jgi:hypothetical protein
MFKESIMYKHQFTCVAHLQLETHHHVAVTMQLVFHLYRTCIDFLVCKMHPCPVNSTMLIYLFPVHQVQAQLAESSCCLLHVWCQAFSSCCN